MGSPKVWACASFVALWLSPCDARKTGRNLSKPFAEVPAKSNTAALPHYLFLILFLGMAFFTDLAVFRGLFAAFVLALLARFDGRFTARLLLFLLLGTHANPARSGDQRQRADHGGHQLERSHLVLHRY